jgi:L-fuculose-phosphate aldolase
MSKKDELILRNDVVRTMALLFEKGLITPMGGNISTRLPASGHFWITPSGLFKGDLKVRDLVKVTLTGNGSSVGLKPSTETPLHSKIYRTRDDVHAIIHAHSPVTLGTAIAGIEIKPITPESVLFVGEVPIVAFEAPGSEDLADRVVEALKSHQVAVMQNHGVVAVGRNMTEALNRLEVVEFTARMMTVAHIWGGTPTLSPSQLEKLKHLATA